MNADNSSCLAQGVIEYALALFFNKLVSYTFLFWLPFYVKKSRKSSDFLSHCASVGHSTRDCDLHCCMTPVLFLLDPSMSSEESDWLSTLFDVGGIIGESKAA